MPTIGRQVPHFNQVDLSSMKAEFSADRLYRYVLRMEFMPDLLQNKRSQTMAVIMKNPSSADERASDATIRKVETFVYHRFPKVKHLIILNLFAIRATYAKEVQENLKDKGSDYVIGLENHEWFKKILNSADEVICAWGGPSGIDKNTYQERIKQAKSLFLHKDFKAGLWQVIGQKPTIQPLHGLMWGYSYELKPYK